MKYMSCHWLLCSLLNLVAYPYTGYLWNLIYETVMISLGNMFSVHLSLELFAAY